MLLADTCVALKVLLQAGCVVSSASSRASNPAVNDDNILVFFLLMHQRRNEISIVCVVLQELLQAGPSGIKQAVADLLEGVEQKKRDGLGRTLSMARLSSTNSNGQRKSCSLTYGPTC